MLKRVLIKYIIHQYRVLLEMHDTLSHINFFFASNQCNYIASDNTYTGNGWCIWRILFDLIILCHLFTTRYVEHYFYKIHSICLILLSFTKIRYHTFTSTNFWSSRNINFVKDIVNVLFEMNSRTFVRSERDIEIAIH